MYINILYTYYIQTTSHMGFGMFGVFVAPFCLAPFFCRRPSKLKAKGITTLRADGAFAENRHFEKSFFGVLVCKCFGIKKALNNKQTPNRTIKTETLSAKQKQNTPPIETTDTKY